MGRVVRLQQRHRAAADDRSSHPQRDDRGGVVRHARHGARRLRRLVVRQRRRGGRLGQPAALHRPDPRQRLLDRRRVVARADVAVARQHLAHGQRLGLSGTAGAQPRLRLRLGRQLDPGPAAAAAYHQHRHRADSAGARKRGRRSADHLDELPLYVAAGADAVVQRAVPPLRLRQPDAPLPGQSVRAARRYRRHLPDRRQRAVRIHAPLRRSGRVGDAVPLHRVPGRLRPGARRSIVPVSSRRRPSTSCARQSTAPD